MAAKKKSAPRGGKRVKIGARTYLCRAVRVNTRKKGKKTTRAFCRRPKTAARKAAKKK